MQLAAPVKGQTTQVCVQMSRSGKTDMKERILETADRLFYLRGIRAVGVDTVAAEIGISKRTLYNHFPSKDALIRAYLSGASRGLPRPTSRRSNKSSARSIGWSAASRARAFAAARSSMRWPNSAGRPGGQEDRARLQGKPAPLVPRPVAAARCPRSGRPCDPAHAARRRLDRAGPGARRSLDGARGERSRARVAQQCRRRGWRSPPRNTLTSKSANGIPDRGISARLVSRTRDRLRSRRARPENKNSPIAF